MKEEKQNGREGREMWGEREGSMRKGREEGGSECKVILLG